MKTDLRFHHDQEKKFEIVLEPPNRLEFWKVLGTFWHLDPGLFPLQLLAISIMALIIKNKKCSKVPTELIFMVTTIFLSNTSR